MKVHMTTVQDDGTLDERDHITIPDEQWERFVTALSGEGGPNWLLHRCKELVQEVGSKVL